MSRAARGGVCCPQMAFGGGPPITHLPPAMKAMFQPGPPLPFKEKLRKRKCPPYTGLCAWTELFETTPPPPRIVQETPRDRRLAKRVAKHAMNELLLADSRAAWDPHAPRAEVADVTTTDAYKTLFVGRLSYETTEAKLRREFEQYGPIKALRVVSRTGPNDTNGHADVPRGYAFIEFEKEADMRTAYKRADGRRIDNRRILVDVERGRTVRNWKPRRLGGGLGGRVKKSPAAAAAAAPKTAPQSTAAYAPPRQPPRPQTAPPAHRYADYRADRDKDRDRGRDRDRHRYRDDERRHRDRDRDRDDRDRERRRRDRSRSRDRSRRY